MEKIDVLYILGTGSKYNNDELRYSLRSLEKFGKNYGRVFIAGVCPKFINREKVIFTPELDIGCRAINHWWKVDQTFRKTDIGDRALLMYDDIFFCKPVNLAKYPWRWRKLLPIDKQENGYKKSLYNAGVWLQKNGFPAIDYCLHQPCIYEKEKFLSMAKDFEELKLSDVGMSPRAIYANRFIDGKIDQLDDLKIKQLVPNLEELIKDRDCFSIADNCLEGPVQEWLENNLPERSKWEK